MLFVKGDLTTSSIQQSLENYNDETQNYFESLKKIFFKTSAPQKRVDYKDEDLISGLWTNFWSLKDMVNLKNADNVLRHFILAFSQVGFQSSLGNEILVQYL